MARTTYATYDRKSADLASEFGREYAERLFGAEAIASLPVRKSGKNKGAPKGHVCWLKTRTAGYSPYMDGGVGVGVVVRAWIGEGPLSNEGDAMRGQWLGRIQNLCGSRCYLGPEAREREAARQAKEAADWEEEKREILEAQKKLAS